MEYSMINNDDDPTMWGSEDTKVYAKLEGNTLSLAHNGKVVIDAVKGKDMISQRTGKPYTQWAKNGYQVNYGTSSAGEWMFVRRRTCSFANNPFAKQKPSSDTDPSDKIPF